MNITPEIQKSLLPIKVQTSKELNQGILDHIGCSIISFLTAFQWVIKLDWDENYEIPGSKKWVSGHKLYGYHLYQTFLLCSDIHARQNSLNNSIIYKDASTWFLSICKEVIRDKILNILVPYEFPTKTVNGQIKQRLIRLHIDEINSIKKGVNPYQNNKNLPALSMLIDCAIEMSEKSSNFKKGRLKQYLDSAFKLIDSLNSVKYQRLFVKNNTLWIQCSKQKRAINLSQKIEF